MQGIRIQRDNLKKWNRAHFWAIFSPREFTRAYNKI